jgi:AraC-like DNA-binding protein
MTLTEYINAKRLHQACSLLGSSDLRVQQVAYTCGFLDVNYFSRLFKRHYGQTPGEYRSSVYRT